MFSAAFGRAYSREQGADGIFTGGLRRPLAARTGRARLVVSNRLNITHFGWLTSWLARGSQPNADQTRDLGEIGVRTIINLQLPSQATAVLTVAPRMLPIHFPLPDHGAPTESDALAWLNLCQHAPRAIYVHCHEGRGRTSVFCCVVRLAQGWTAEDAIAEQSRLYGFDVREEPRQAEFLRRFGEDVRAGRLRLPGL